MDLTGRSWESFWDDVKFVGEVLLGTAVATACIGLAVLSIAGSIGLTGISGGAGAVSIPAAVAVAGELLKEAGGEAIRVDLGHSPGGVSTHTYPHIHYKINGSEKNVIRIIEVLP